MCFILGGMASPAGAETPYFIVGDGDTIAEYATGPLVAPPRVTGKGATARSLETLHASHVSMRQDKTASPASFLTPAVSLTLIGIVFALGFVVSGKRGCRLAYLISEIGLSSHGLSPAHVSSRQREAERRRAVRSPA